MKKNIVKEGSLINYTVNGNIINFNDELMFNLARYEQDFEVRIDVCRTQLGYLTFSTDNAKGIYVAQITIPERKYEFIENGADEDNIPILEKKQIEFNIDNCTIELWGE